MKAKAQILDYRDDGTSKCFLSRMSLEEYVNILPSSYQDYDIQREIVSNVYLDHLVETVLNHRHIPPIVLVIDSADKNIENNTLELESFKILDGLQRTYRLQSIRKTIEFCCTQLDPNENYLSWTKFQFSRTFSSQLHQFDSNTDVLRAIVEVFQRNGKESLLKTFTENNQWFEIWSGLTPEEEVRKMLMLNAGHKPVKTRHQLELIFLNLLPILREGEGKDFILVREKEISSTQFSKERKVGMFHFAHVITALLSLYDRKPITPSTSLIQGIQSIESGVESYVAQTTPTVLKSIVAFLVRLDHELTTQYGENGCLWMGREVSLAGLFGAIGAVAGEKNSDPVDVMNHFYSICKSNPKILNLDQFEVARNSLDLSKINIGSANRSAVYSAIREILEITPPPMIEWKKHFGVGEK